MATHPAKDSDHLPWQVRHVLECGLFATFARAFNRSRGDPPLPPAPTENLSDDQRRVFRWAIDERNKAWAHVDRSGTRRTFTPADPGAPMLVTWRPPNPDELLELAELAEALAAEYRDMLTEIEGPLGDEK